MPIRRDQPNLHARICYRLDIEISVHLRELVAQKRVQRSNIHANIHCYLPAQHLKNTAPEPAHRAIPAAVLLAPTITST
jgi:hypothetical protein